MGTSWTETEECPKCHKTTEVQKYRYKVEDPLGGTNEVILERYDCQYCGFRMEYSNSVYG